jgi:small subunit ribosomal protein S15Ae
VVQLNGRLNKTGVISPRFNVQVTQIESWVNLLLPARSFGKLILVSALAGSHFVHIIGMLMACVKTTSSGILDHEEARRKNVGGKILGYIY